MAVHQCAYGAAKSTCAVPMDYSHLAQTCEGGFVKKLVYCVNCFIRGLSDNVQLRLSLLFRSSSKMNFGISRASQFFQFALLRLCSRRRLHQLQIFELLPEPQ